MKFMVTWSIPPSTQREAVQRFLDGGAPLPDGLTKLGRWHEPGTGSGFLLVEADDLAPLATHVAEWGNLLVLRVTPVMDDEEAGPAYAKGIE